MRALVVWGSRAGGTQEIAQRVASRLREAGLEVKAVPAREVARIDPDTDVVIVGGALYAFTWHADARHFLARHRARLRQMPVWCFSSGPLDDSARREDIPPVPGLRPLMQRAGVKGHITFGGRIAEGATGMARNMPKGDWRDLSQIDGWARQVGLAVLAGATPGQVVEPEGGSALRLVTHAALAGAITGALGLVAPTALLALAAPVAAALLAVAYFRPAGARAPLWSALAFAAAALAFLALTGPPGWRLVLPPVLVFTAAWTVGLRARYLPEIKRATKQAAAAPAGPHDPSAGHAT